MFLKKAFSVQWVFLFALLVLCLPVRAQEGEGVRTSRDESSARRAAEPSDLGRENLSRVAAGVGQIQEVLLGNAGLMVELKRWVAKEVTDSGQVVEDSALTDQAIFERLARDVMFRAVATRLLQRYGYLLPTVNPASDSAKEQEFVLKERARRLVRIEAEEDSRVLQPERTDRGTVERTASCDPRTDENCEPSRTRGSRSFQTPARPGEMTPPETPPAGVPDQQQLSPAQPRTLRAGQARQADGLSDGLALSNDGELVPASARTGGVSVDAGARPGPTASGQGGAMESTSSITTLGRSESGETLATKSTAERQLTWKRSRVETEKMDLSPVAMVRRANPYADIPSLYDMYVQAASHQRKAERFGLDVFRNGAAEPNAVPMDLPVGPDYVVGPGDGLAIDLWGGVSQRLFRVVDREGRLSLPEVGPVLVSGKTLADVQQSVQQLLRTQFRDVSADISLSRLRTVRVYVVGDVAEPGAYDISSLSSPLNALFVAGGVTPRGSLRALKQYRGKELVQEVDAYDLLLHGVRGDLKRLENGDTLLVPPIGPQITIDGMVRRPAIYELRGETSLADALELAGGILPAATLSHIEVQRIEAHVKRTMLTVELPAEGGVESTSEQLRAFKIQDGDEVHIFPMAPYNQSAIYLQGHVLRPGRYSYREGMKLTDVIASYGDLLPEPAAHYVEIVRLNSPDFHPSVESFDLAAALANPAAAPKLQPLDTVRVYSRFDFEPAPSVFVGGEVRAPGSYGTSGQVHLRDAVYLAGGVTPDSALDSTQLFRTQPDGTMKILSVNLAEALAGDPVDNLLLQPRDRIIVHRILYRVDPPSVYIKGEVSKPGRYPLAVNMQVTDLLRAAGGPKRSADLRNTDLTRYEATSGKRPAGEHERVDLSVSLTDDESRRIPLKDGDVLTVPQLPRWNDLGAVVTLSGEVRNSGTYGIRPGERLSSLLKRAGGLLPTAYPQGAIFMRRDVRELQEKNRQELIQRIEQESTLVKTSVTTTGTEEAALQQAAMQQRERVLGALRKAPVSGRLVIQLRPGMKGFDNSPQDIELRAGDTLEIPKRPGFVLVVGQVYNTNAITYVPGKNAGWYLSRAGGATQLADKGAIFIVRASGDVRSRHQGGWWSGSVLSAVIGPGDTIVVPERPVLGSSRWKNFLAIAQLAQLGAVTAAIVP